MSNSPVFFSVLLVVFSFTSNCLATDPRTLCERENRLFAGLVQAAKLVPLHKQELVQLDKLYRDSYDQFVRADSSGNPTEELEQAVSEYGMLIDDMERNLNIHENSARGYGKQLLHLYEAELLFASRARGQRAHLRPSTESEQCKAIVTSILSAVGSDHAERSFTATY